MCWCMERRTQMTRTNGNGDGATAVHIALQGKGGVGKSLVSAILSQYLASKGQDVLAIDADPVNHTLAEYRGLAVSKLNHGIRPTCDSPGPRSEEHTSELQSPDHLVCRLLLEKKNS